MNSDKSLRFAKLMPQMGQPKQLANPQIDDNTAKRLEMDNKLAMIDQKIAQLEQSEDPNALESLNFWKNKRAEMVRK